MNDRSQHRWQVRVRSREDPDLVLGAGVLLGPEFVLTCAHVALRAPELVVDLMGHDGLPAVGAEVVDELCVAEFPGVRRGDVALLRLREPRPADDGARLRRLAITRDRPARVLGYPRLFDDGLWALTTLVGRVGPEWVQMNRRSDVEQRVRAGFSGSGVVDDLTGDVVGIVVAEYTDEEAGLSWMLPTEAIIAHLPLVDDWAVGGRGVDPSFTRPGLPADDRATELATQLRARSAEPGVRLVGGRDVDALRQAVMLSGPGTEPLADLAIDVAGQSVEEVSRRIADRVGLTVDDGRSSRERLAAGTPPMTVVAVEVDRAEDPESLIRDVFTPLVLYGARLVLGLRDEDSVSRSMVRDLAIRAVGIRLDGLARRVAALDRRHARQITRLTGWLADTRLAAEVDPEGVVERLLQRLERRVARLEPANPRGTGVAAERGRLEALTARAGDAGMVEHEVLVARHRRATELIAVEPPDLEAVRAAVQAYDDALRRLLEEQR